MALAVPHFERILVELKTRLEAINALTSPDTYKYTVGAVLRPWEFDVENLVPAKDFVIQFMAGRGHDGERTTGPKDCEDEIWVLLSKFWRPDTQSVYTLTPPVAQTIQNDMLADLEAAVQAWKNDNTGASGVAFGALLTELKTTDRDRTPRVKADWNWVQAEVRLLAFYTRQRTAR